MLSLQFIRQNPDVVQEALAKRHTEAPIGEILALDEQRRRLLLESETLRAHRNEVSRQIASMKDRPSQLIDEMRQVGDRIKSLDEESRVINEGLEAQLLEVPNIPHPKVPLGNDESENVVVRSEGQLPQFDFAPLPHWDLGERLGIIDFERGVKISGSRFYILKGHGARLQRALITFMLDLHTTQHGYKEIYPPFMV